MKSPSKNRKKHLDETSDANKILPLAKNELNSKAVAKSLNKKLKATTSKTDTHLLELSLNEPLVNHNSSFAISPSSMSPSSSTYSSSSIIRNVSSKKRAVKDTRQFE